MEHLITAFIFVMSSFGVFVFCKTAMFSYFVHLLSSVLPEVFSTMIVVAISVVVFVVLCNALVLIVYYLGDRFLLASGDGGKDTE